MPGLIIFIIKSELLNVTFSGSSFILAKKLLL